MTKASELTQQEREVNNEKILQYEDPRLDSNRQKLILLLPTRVSNIKPIFRAAGLEMEVKIPKVGLGINEQSKRTYLTGARSQQRENSTVRRPSTRF